MRSKARIGLTAGVAAAVVVVAAAPLAALPPPGDDGEAPPPVERPTTTRPQPTTTTAEPRVLESLTVTSDSVVATATVRYSGRPSLVTVQWGDGSSTSRNPADATDSPFPDPWTPSDPPGVSVFTHTYAAPSDGAAFPVAVTARIGTESQTTAATITPRYRVTQGIVHLSIIDACDTSFEDTTDWYVERYANGLAFTYWKFEQDNDGFPPYALPADSAVTVERTAQQGRDPALRYIGYTVKEYDFFVEDYVGAASFSVDPALGSRTVTKPLTQDEGCRGELSTDIEVTLLTPGTGSGPVATP
jgi:hypothetical protein